MSRIRTQMILYRPKIVCFDRAQVVGWPPVRAYRKNAMKGSCKFVKVAVDGAPYLRKVDLEIYHSYQELLSALEDMFSFLTISKFCKYIFFLNFLNKEKLCCELNLFI